MKATNILALAAVSGLVFCASAAPRESATYTNVLSESFLDDAANQVRTQVFTGGYQVGRLRVSGTLTAIADTTWLEDSRIVVTAPGGQQTVLLPMPGGFFTGSMSVTDAVFRVNPVIATSAGTWNFRFYENVVDVEVAGPDANWDTITFTLDDDVSPPPGDLPNTASVPQGSGTLSSVSDSLGTDGLAHMYKIQICSPASFQATTVNGTMVDTQLYLFNAAGFGVAYSDQVGFEAQSTITSQFTASLAAGDYYLAVSEWDTAALDSTGNRLWNDTPWDVERAPDGPGAANPVAGWLIDTVEGGSYTISLTGACFVGPSFNCIADVDDGSATGTQDGAVTIDDLLYFLGAFESGSTDADIDNGTSTGTTDGAVTIDDLLFFLVRFEEGC